MHEILVERLHVAEVVVGANFTFGHKAAGDLDMLTEFGQRFGFTTQGVGLLSEEDVTVSSTYIRSCVAAGDVEAARQALGRPHRVEGVVVRGERRGRDLGYPTANVDSPVHAAIPADGIYAAWFTRYGYEAPEASLTSGVAYPGAVSVGTNPTFSGQTRTVEVFVLDSNADLYGQHVAVDFVQRLRGMVKFDSVEDLINAMDADVVKIRAILAADKAAGDAARD